MRYHSHESVPFDIPPATSFGVGTPGGVVTVPEVPDDGQWHRMEDVGCEIDGRYFARGPEGKRVVMWGTMVRVYPPRS